MAMNNIRYSVISDLSPDGIVYINKNGRIEYVNTAFYEITGYSSKDLLGIDENTLNTIMRYLCETDHRGAFDITRKDARVVIQLERPLSRLISCTSRLIENKEGQFQGKIFYFHDITCEQEAEECIKSEFLSTAAHKLRTPLVGILGFSELLLKRDFDLVKQREVVATIFRQASNFKQMFDDFLDIERLDLKKGKSFNIKKATLEKVLNSVLSDVKNTSQAVDIIIEPSDVWPEVNFDFDKMKQVFSNLITNAVKYSPEGSKVVCNTVVRSNNSYEESGVCISDQGIGIAPSDLRHVGERFYRVGELPSVSGSGLGIAIVKSIVAIHKGRFELTSTKGKGSTAIVWLPVNKDPL